MKRRMKTASYRAGVAWIADQDNSTTMDAEVVSTQNTTRLLATLFAVDTYQVALEVLMQRRSAQTAMDFIDDLDDLEDIEDQEAAIDHE